MWKVEISESGYKNYLENVEDGKLGERYFGYFDCLLPDYSNEEQTGIEINIITQGIGKRPIIEIGSNIEKESKLVDDYIEGISKLSQWIE